MLTIRLKRPGWFDKIYSDVRNFEIKNKTKDGLGQEVVHAPQLSMLRSNGKITLIGMIDTKDWDVIPHEVSNGASLPDNV